MNKKWEICEQNKELVEKIARENNLSELMATLRSEERRVGKEC